MDENIGPMWVWLHASKIPTQLKIKDYYVARLDVQVNRYMAVEGVLGVVECGHKSLNSALIYDENLNKVTVSKFDRHTNWS